MPMAADPRLDAATVEARDHLDPQLERLSGAPDQHTVALVIAGMVGGVFDVGILTIVLVPIAFIIAASGSSTRPGPEPPAVFPAPR